MSLDYRSKGYLSDEERAERLKLRKKGPGPGLVACREWVSQHLQVTPCADCGLIDPVVMEFDHVRGVKVASVSVLMGRGNLEALKAEAEKCDVVCANDHRRRTAARAGWTK